VARHDEASAHPHAKAPVANWSLSHPAADIRADDERLVTASCHMQPPAPRPYRSGLVSRVSHGYRASTPSTLAGSGTRTWI